MIKKIFEKNEITFAILLIVLYVVGESITQRLSEAVGINSFAEAVFGIILSTIIFIFIKRNGLMQYLGLTKPEIPHSKMLFYIPLFLIGSFGAFFGLGLEHNLPGTIFHTLAMICVGFLEEVIFRGFLFKGIAKQNLIRAVIISSVTFGIGHIVNFFNGCNLFNNIIQIIFAVMVGFMLVMIFLRTGSTIPCIVFHAFNNCMTAFISSENLIGKVGEQKARIIILTVNCIIAAAFTFYVTKLPQREHKQ